MARLYVKSYVRLKIAIYGNRLLIFWRRWYTEDCMRIPACGILKLVGKRFADALVSCRIVLTSFSFSPRFRSNWNSVLFRMTSCDI